MKHFVLISSLILLCGVGMASAHQAPAAATSGAPAKDAASAPSRQLLHPGDRACIQSTGSLIPAKPGHCLMGVAGRSYSRQDLQNTGQNQLGQALEQLDPSVSLGH